MNLIAIDIGNSSIKVAFYYKDQEKFLRTLPAGDDLEENLRATLTEAGTRFRWSKMRLSRLKTRSGSQFRQAGLDETAGTNRKDQLGKVLLIGRDIPIPIETSVDNPLEVGTDRLVSAAAAFAVVEDAVVVADFGTAVTIDLVDETGVFVGGTISPDLICPPRCLKTTRPHFR